MKLQTLAAACAAVVALSAAGSAFANDAVVAKLSAPITGNAKFIAGGAVFICTGDTCVAAAPTSQTYAVAACKVVVKNTGPVASYSSASKSLEADKIAACNAAKAN